MGGNEIVPAGETRPQQDAEADDFDDGYSGGTTCYLPNMWVFNPFIGIANVGDNNEWVKGVHSPTTEMGAYESLWMSPSASFRGLANVLGAEYETLPSDFVETSVIFDMYQEIIERFGDALLKGLQYVVRRDPRYPIRMLDAKDRVQMFYYTGYIDRLYTRCVSVIGSRNASREGQRRAARLTRKLVESGFTIVSGLSAGIDTVAARTALDCGGKVVAVIGTPITEYSPKENKELQEEISKKHLLISQVPMMRYSLQTKKENRMFFRERDMTMSALSEASLIIEAGNGSEALRQARAAFYQKRKVLVHDSCFKDAKLTWPARFEKRGAIRIRSSRDLVKELAAPPPHISVDSSVPFQQEDESDNDHAERIAAYFDSGAMPGYPPAAAEDLQQNGSSIGKYWRFIHQATRHFSFLEWLGSRRDGGEILEVPESLPSE